MPNGSSPPESIGERTSPAHVSCLEALQRRRPQLHWALLTSAVTATAWLVANAVPFFSDLVGLIGGLTQAPLSLLLPTVFYRRVARPLGHPHGLASALILAAASLLVLYGTSSALSKIGADWTSFGQPFACGKKSPHEGADNRLPTLRKPHVVAHSYSNGTSRELLAGQRQRTPPGAHSGGDRTNAHGHMHRQNHLHG